METNWKQWEKPLIEIDETIKKLKELTRLAKPEKREEIEQKISEFETRRNQYIAKVYGKLVPWEKVLIARAEPRPYTLDYIHHIFTQFIELDGDRRFGADHAIVGGPALLNGTSCMVIGHQKGRNIQDRQYRNFGMAKPEGYRKAIRLMDMAERFNLPVITFADTSAADPSVESEARGISEAIASSMLKMFELTVPVISVIIGEGGSGGAIGIAVGNKVFMLEHAVYSVIPPEGCAAILWRQPEQGPKAAQVLRLTAQEAERLQLIDGVIKEPFGGAHRNPAEVAESIKSVLLSELNALLKLKDQKLKQQRYDRFRALGVYKTLAADARSHLA